MKYYLTPVRMAVINKSTNTKCLKGYGEKGTLVHYWWECRVVQPLWKAVWSYLKKLKMKLPYDQAIPLLRIYSKQTKTLFEKYIYTPMFISALFTIAENWKQPNCPLVNEWVSKPWYIYTMEYYSVITKKDICPGWCGSVG